MVARKNQVVSGLVKGIATLFKAWNIEYVYVGNNAIHQLKRKA